MNENNGHLGLKGFIGFDRFYAAHKEKSHAQMASSWWNERHLKLILEERNAKLESVREAAEDVVNAWAEMDRHVSRLIDGELEQLEGSLNTMEDNNGED